mgnify:CR=1 FL=1
MTQEHKDLLLKDLCARLPYGVKLQISSWDDANMEYVDKADTLYSISSDNYVRTSSEDQDFYIDKVKPYLFPISSMTEKQKNEYDYWKHMIPVCHYEYGDVVEEVELFDSPESFEYLIENKFDCFGLIPKGLAIDATNQNVY